MTMTADDNENEDVHPWRIYGKEYKVPESKMGKSETEKAYPMLTSSGEGSKVTRGGATIHLQKPKEKKKDKPRAIDLGTAPTIGKATAVPDMEKERALGKSIEMLNELEKSISPSPDRNGTDLLKACKASMEKAEDEKKAYLGELAIPERGGAKPKFTGEGAMRAGTSYGEGPMKVGKEKTSEAELKEGMAKMGKAVEGTDKATPIEIPGGSIKGAVNKAVTARSIPRLPRALQQEMIRRNAQSVMTRGNSRFAKDIHTGPLTGEVIETVEEEAQKRTRPDVYKACGGCGRRYRLFKGVDSGCPTCSINKSTHCSKCQTQLVKSHGGTVRCPLCG